MRSTPAAAVSFTTRARSWNSSMCRSTSASSAVFTISAKNTSRTQKISVTFSGSPRRMPLPTQATSVAATTWIFMFR